MCVDHATKFPAEHDVFRLFFFRIIYSVIISESLTYPAHQFTNHAVPAALVLRALRTIFAILYDS